MSTPCAPPCSAATVSVLWPSEIVIDGTAGSAPGVACAPPTPETTPAPPSAASAAGADPTPGAAGIFVAVPSPAVPRPAAPSPAVPTPAVRPPAVPDAGGVSSPVVGLIVQPGGSVDASRSHATPWPAPGTAALSVAGAMGSIDDVTPDTAEGVGGVKPCGDAAGDTADGAAAGALCGIDAGGDIDASGVLGASGVMGAVGGGACWDCAGGVPPACGGPSPAPDPCWSGDGVVACP